MHLDFITVMEEMDCHHVVLKPCNDIYFDIVYIAVLNVYSIISHCVCFCVCQGVSVSV